MRLIDTPYMKRVLSSDEEMHQFVNRMMARCDRDEDSETMADLAMKITAARSGMRYGSEEWVELTPKLNLLCSYIQTRFNGSNWMLPYVVIAHMNGEFGGDLNALRRTMRRIDEAEDSDAARDYMTDNVGVEYCNGCDEYEYSDEMQTTYDDENRCRSCISNNYTHSSYYDQYIYYENAVDAVDENGNGVTISNDDDDFVYDDDSDTYHHRNYRPTPQVFGEYHSSKRKQQIIKDDWSVAKHRWLGVELEVELRDEYGDRVEKSRVLNDVINGGEVGKRVFFERDGSLHNGIEIISQPMSLPMHHELWQWLNNRTAVAGMRSHNTSTCGLHVHVNRDALSQIQIARIVTFINDPNNSDLIRAIARRYAEGYCRIKEKKLEDAAWSSDRYEAVNITGSNTIEFRIFKGSLKYESVVAAIEFANSMVDFSTKFTKAEDLSTTNFLQFINDDVYKETTYLRPYINNRLELA